MRLPNLLATKNGRLAAFFLLYMTEGIPLGFAATAVATKLRRLDVGPAEIGAFVGMSKMTPLAKVLERLDETPNFQDLEDRYPFHRILVLLGPPSVDTDDVVLRLGARGVERVVREQAGAGGQDDTFAPRVAEAIAAWKAKREGEFAPLTPIAKF